MCNADRDPRAYERDDQEFTALERPGQRVDLDAQGSAADAL
jgi:hypothetical protein